MYRNVIYPTGEHEWVCPYLPTPLLGQDMTQGQFF